MSKLKLLKRITPPPVTRIVTEAPAGEPLSMDEINEIVHEVRRQRRASETCNSSSSGTISSCGQKE